MRIRFLRTAKARLWLYLSLLATLATSARIVNNLKLSSGPVNHKQLSPSVPGLQGHQEIFRQGMPPGLDVLSHCLL